MATIIPFPVTKLAPAETQPFAFVDADRVGSGAAQIVSLADYRTQRASLRKRAQGWLAGQPFNMNLCLE